MLKTIFINLLKLAVAGGLIYWLVTSGKLDFRLLGELGNHPFQVVFALTLGLFNLWLISIRWRKILRARSETKLPAVGLLKVNWIGQFFSSVLPGSVSGDLVKMLYVGQLDPSFSRKFILVSIFIDRLMGLSGLILLVGLSSAFFSGHILEKSPAMKPLLMVNLFLVVAVLLSLGLFFFFHGVVRKLLDAASKYFFRNLWLQLIALWDDLTTIRGKIVKAVGISVIVQLIAVLQFWFVIYPFVSDRMDFREALAFIPIGLMTLALPVAPSGLGVGHAIFQKLFQFSGIENGASLFNLYFFVTLSFNVLGVIPYILSKKRPKG